MKTHALCSITFQDPKLMRKTKEVSKKRKEYKLEIDVKKKKKNYYQTNF
jgi:hypothetical protein